MPSCMVCKKLKQESEKGSVMNWSKRCMTRINYDLKRHPQVEILTLGEFQICYCF